MKATGPSGYGQAMKYIVSVVSGGAMLETCG
jgi:hypothetical protein